jgi:UDP-2-acetamido-3-amino-2,3-dideoxy-glucuronate N-acetyltransferase
VLGNNVKVQNNVSLYDGVICEDDVFLGPSCVFTNIINPRSAVSEKNEFQKNLVKKGPLSAPTPPFFAALQLINLHL